MAVVAVLSAAVFAIAPAARADFPMPPPPVPLPPPAVGGLYPMVFPIQTDQANYYYSDTWGACRSGCTRGHLGVDILSASGAKGYPVVAVADGTITWTADPCCAIAISHDDDWKSYYIHLNNDTQNPDGSYSDDGLSGYLPGVYDGARVERGQIIGLVGDSGNAEGVRPHLHFELWAPVDLDADNWRDRHQAINPTPHAAAVDGIPADPEEGERPCESGVCDSVGLITPGGQWALWDALSAEGSVDAFYYGNPGDVAFMGDWDGDGVATPGLYRQSDGFVYLRNSNTEGVADVTFFFGNPGDYPLVGDFDDDGDDTVSIYRQTQAKVYVVNELGEDGGGLGEAETEFFFGNPGDNPFVGDFDGDGVDTVGLHRSSTGFVYFRNSLTSGNADLSFFYGNPGDIILAGDWDGDGDDTVAVYRPSRGRVYVNLENASGAADYSLYVGGYSGAVTFGQGEA